MTSMLADLGPAFGASGVGSELFRTNTQSQQFVSMLSALYKRLGPLYDPDAATFEDANAWSKVLRDDRFRSFIATRLAKVARLTWTMEPASDREEDVSAASTVEKAFRTIPHFTASRRHLAKFAFWGRSYAWIEGRRDWKVMGVSKLNPLGVLGEWWNPTSIKPLDRRQVIVVTKKATNSDGREVVTSELHLGTIDAGVHRAMEHPECLVECVYDDEVERFGYGRGLLETLYHVYWIKGVVRRIGLSGLEKWANGIVVAALDSNARNATDDGTANLAAETLNVIMAMRDGGGIVVDSKDKVDVLTTSGQGGDLTMKWLAYCDEGAAQLILGSIRPTGGGEGGSYDRAETESDVTDDLLDCDREMIDETITRSVVKLWWDMNQSNLLALGLGTASPPRFRSLHVDREDPEKVGRVLKLAQEAGAKIEASDAYRRLGLKKPGPNDEVLDAPKPEPLFGGFGGEDGPPKPGEEKPDPEPTALARLPGLWRTLARGGWWKRKAARA